MESKLCYIQFMKIVLVFFITRKHDVCTLFGPHCSKNVVAFKKKVRDKLSKQDTCWWKL